MKRFFVPLFSILLAVTLLSPLSTSFAQENEGNEETLEAVVSRIVSEETISFEGQEQYLQKIELKVTRGSLAGKTVLVDGVNVQTTNSLHYKVGEKVLVLYTQTPDGEQFFFISDYVRRRELLILFALFAALVIVVGGVHGALSLVAMAVSFGVIFVFILPNLIAGYDPVIVSLVGATIIAPLTFYISHGWNTKTHIAIGATLGTLLITAILSAVFLPMLRLTGFSSEEANFLQNQTQGILNMKGLLLAGIIIGVLGILDDITVSQTSVVEQIKQVNPKIAMHTLFGRAMKVGRDHIASLVNTLVLVYTGASLPLLLLFIDNPHPFSEVINYEFLAEEIARVLIGSIGLVLAVPIATYIACVAFSRKTR